MRDHNNETLLTVTLFQCCACARARARACVCVCVCVCVECCGSGSAHDNICSLSVYFHTNRFLTPSYKNKDKRSVDE